ncbi:MAG: RdgB/HAM1 family non-canonical purine NTP pyrophosphatase [Oscillospiraceae bacterium]|nr:RdgB/HAM1 family non-canonical purine NTP pyrophosphatase [Oscillospiraceae bacterium]
MTRETYASHTFLLASSNAHKIAEMRELLAPQGIRLLAPSDIGLDLDVDETGETFRDNALLKARAYCAAAKLPAIADDSGLCVDALDGAPGVYSARYGGTSGDAAHIALLLKNLDGATDRAAKFVCAIACVFPNGDELRADGECHGEIARETRGDNGFGYDPVFWLPQFGKSMAELTAAEKNAMSHRGLAVREFSEKLERYLHND